MEGAQDLQKMLVTYAKQETVDPLKTLGKYLGFGIGGAICMFLSIFFISLGALRFLQGIEKFGGGGAGSLVPYLGSFATLIVMMAIVLISLLRAKKRVSS